MPGNASKAPGANSKSKLKLSGGNLEPKPNINPVSAQGEITSPSDISHPSRRHSSQAPGRQSPSLQAQPSIIDITKHPLYEDVQRLDPKLKTFLEHDWETNSKYKHTKLKFYHILYHFNPATKAQPTHRLDALKKEFVDDLLPKLSAFCLPPPTSDDAMETDDPALDYNPLHRKTTTAMLIAAIERKDRRVKVSPVALKDDVLVLYKYYVNPDLHLPQIKKFTARPRTVHSSMVSKLSIQELRHAIQLYHPEIFLNVPVLRLAHYMSVYRTFILEEPQGKAEEPLVPGYHYWINADMLGDNE